MKAEELDGIVVGGGIVKDPVEPNPEKPAELLAAILPNPPPAIPEAGVLPKPNAPPEVAEGAAASAPKLVIPEFDDPACCPKIGVSPNAVPGLALAANAPKPPVD